jgi:hypothetical protein
MKKLLLILLCLPFIGFAQSTYVPDDNFEQALINLGYDNVLDDYVLTAYINNVTSLLVAGQNITDLTGIEDFISLTTLNCYSNQLTTLDVSSNIALTTLYCRTNQLTSLDVSSNTALTYLDCNYNQLTTLDVSTNTALTYLECSSNQLTTLGVSGTTALTTLWCSENQLTTLDVSNNTALTKLECSSNQLTTLGVSGTTALTTLWCSENQLTTLDVSNNTALTKLWCSENQLTTLDVSSNTALDELICRYNQLITLDVSSNITLDTLICGHQQQLTTLDLRNGNNTNLQIVSANNCPNLYCINVDDVAWATANWTVANGNIDSWANFSLNCPSPSAIQEHTTNKELLKVTDLLGRETKQKNKPLFYIYDDGTVEKRIVIEQ